MDGLLPDAVTTVSKADLEPFSNRKRVGSYLFGRTIGQGSFAKVKEGLHVSTGEKVAIKIINKKRARADRYVSRNLKREADIMQRVRHHNVVRLLEVMETDSFYYLVTELCCGGELLDLICERKYLDEDTARKYIAQLVSAVCSMHSSGVLHRDLKIENFLLDQQGDLKIVDFGLSNALPDDGIEAWKRTGICPLLLTTYCGSPAYAAPELLAQKPYGAQIDLWSIGVNMFAMLTGNLPYNMERFNIIDMYHKMMERRMMPFPSHVTPEARDLIIQLLDPVPETRIALKEVIQHPWLRPAKKYFLHCEAVAANPPVEVNQNIVLHMADNIGVSMREVVNSVKQNRASHSFAIYFLLHEKLKRFERRRRGQMAGDSSIAKVKVVKKATLRDDVSLKNKFTYKGMKIVKGAVSHHSLYEKDSDGTRSDDDNEHETTHSIENTERWNQYATFPRDRRTSCFDQSNVNTLVHATLDKGSDDIDYHRTSSPETTDNSASSHESMQVLRQQLKCMETRDLSMKKRRTRKESGSDEDIFARSRSKSLTGQEEYGYTQQVFSGDGRHRASTTTTFSNHLDVKTINSSLPIKLKALFCQNIPRLKELNIPESFESLRYKSSGFDIKETAVGTIAGQPYDSKERVTFDPMNTKNCVKDSANGFGGDLNDGTENHGNEHEPSFVDTVLKKRQYKNRFFNLSSTSEENTHSTRNTEIVPGNVTEIIPPPTPFSDQDLKVNIEVVEPRNIKSLASHEERELPNQLGSNVVAAGSNAKARAARKGQRRPVERSKSFSEVRKHAYERREFKRIELEKIKRIELEPLQHTLAQVEPVPQAVYRLPMHHVQNDKSLDSSITTGINRNSEGALNVTRLLNEKLDKTMILGAEKQFEGNQFEFEKDRHEAMASIEQRAETNEFDEGRMKANLFRINVVKLAKCQCIPVLRPKIFEPVMWNRGMISAEAATKNRGILTSHGIEKESCKGKYLKSEEKQGYSSNERLIVSDERKKQDTACSTNNNSRPKTVSTRGLKGSCRRTKRSGDNGSRNLNEFGLLGKVKPT